MFDKLAVGIAVWLLKKSTLNVDLRNTLVLHTLDKLGALPFRDILTANTEGDIIVGERTLDKEQAFQLRESAKAALDNQAITLAKAQVAWKAVVMGVHKAENPDQMIFAKAALWYGQELEDMLATLANRK